MKAKRETKGSKGFGFTLIELLVVISIIGLISSLVLFYLNSSQEKAKYARAKADLNQINNALAILAADTGKWAGGCPAGTWANAETLLSDNVHIVTGSGRDFDSIYSGLGVQPPVGVNPLDSTSGYHDHPCEWTAKDVNAWQRPYAHVPLDPWGHSYVFDPDFCDDMGYGRAVLLSLGPNGREEYKSNCGLGNGFDAYGPPGISGDPAGDDIVLYPAGDLIPYITPP